MTLAVLNISQEPLVALQLSILLNHRLLFINIWRAKSMFTYQGSHDFGHLFLSNLSVKTFASDKKLVFAVSPIIFAQIQMLGLLITLLAVLSELSVPWISSKFLVSTYHQILDFLLLKPARILFYLPKTYF